MVVPNHIKRPEFTDHAVALGHLVLYWNQLEQEIELVLTKLLTEVRGRTPKLTLVFPLLDLRKKMDWIELFGFMESLDNDWFQRLKECLKVINGLYDARNRTIHDPWLLGPSGTVSRMDRRPKIAKPQAKKARVMTGGTMIDISPNDIWELNARIYETFGSLRELGHDLETGAASPLGKR